jgi:hypothetical protein
MISVLFLGVCLFFSWWSLFFANMFENRLND